MRDDRGFNRFAVLTDSIFCGAFPIEDQYRVCTTPKCGFDEERGVRNDVKSNKGVTCPKRAQSACDFLLRPGETWASCEANCTSYPFEGKTKTSYTLTYVTRKTKRCKNEDCGFDYEAMEATPVRLMQCRDARHGFDVERVNEFVKSADPLESRFALIALAFIQIGHPGNFYVSLLKIESFFEQHKKKSSGNAGYARELSQSLDHIRLFVLQQREKFDRREMSDLINRENARLRALYNN